MLLKPLLLSSALLISLQAWSAPTQELNIYNWIEYTPEHMIGEFENLTDIQVNQTTFETQEMLDTKLLAGSSGYDVVVPMATNAEALLKKNLFHKLDKSKIPNYAHLDPALMAKLEAIDPGNQYFIPWSWGYTGIGINEKLVKKALGSTPLPENPYELIFNPSYTQKLKKCGIFILNSPQEVFSVALPYIGKPNNSESAEDYRTVLNQVLKPIRKDIRKFGDSSMVQDMMDNQYCVAFAWANDIDTASINSHNSSIHMLHNGPDALFFDVMAIPADAKNIDNAYKWINYSLEPVVGAQMVNELNFPTANKESLKYIDAEHKSNDLYMSKDHLHNKTLRRLPSNSVAYKEMYRAFKVFKKP